MRKRMQALLKNEKGFTLVELLAVIVILGIIAAIAIPSIANIIDNSKKDAHVSNAEQLVNAARMAVAANDKALWITSNTGVTGDAIDRITMDELVTAGYLEAAIEDPDNTDAATPGYGTAYVDIVTAATPSAKVTYKVYLEGDERLIGTSSTSGQTTTKTSVDAANLSRANVGVK